LFGKTIQKSILPMEETRTIEKLTFSMSSVPHSALLQCKPSHHTKPSPNDLATYVKAYAEHTQTHK